MATWHQQRSSAPLFHSTQWTLLTDPPNEPRSAMLFETEAAAVEQLERWKANGSKSAAHSYILPPGGVRSTPGQLAYEEDVRRKPTHHDGTRRPHWAELGEPQHNSWDRNPTPRDWTKQESR